MRSKSPPSKLVIGCVILLACLAVNPDYSCTGKQRRCRSIVASAAAVAASSEHDYTSGSGAVQHDTERQSLLRRGQEATIGHHDEGRRLKKDEKTPEPTPSPVTAAPVAAPTQPRPASSVTYVVSKTLKVPAPAPPSIPQGQLIGEGSLNKNFLKVSTDSNDILMAQGALEDSGADESVDLSSSVALRRRRRRLVRPRRRDDVP